MLSVMVTFQKLNIFKFSGFWLWSQSLRIWHTHTHTHTMCFFDRSYIWWSTGPLPALQFWDNQLWSRSSWDSSVIPFVIWKLWELQDGRKKSWITPKLPPLGELYRWLWFSVIKDSPFLFCSSHSFSTIKESTRAPWEWSQKCFISENPLLHRTIGFDTITRFTIAIREPVRLEGLPSAVVRQWTETPLANPALLVDW